MVGVTIEYIVAALVAPTAVIVALWMLVENELSLTANVGEAAVLVVGALCVSRKRIAVEYIGVCGANDWVLVDW